LSPDPDHLRTIVAHEFGHAAHNIITNEAGIDWTKMNWNSPVIWLNQEGVATHLSRQIVPNMHPSIYFSYSSEGKEWLSFSGSNKDEIKKAFAKDYSNETPQAIFREWFSISGGNKFGFSRLGYFIGDMFFQNQIKDLGELKAITAWKDNIFEEQATQWLFKE
jgi:hypothetical protein